MPTAAETGGRTVFHGSDDAGPKMLVLQHFQRVDQVTCRGGLGRIGPGGAEILVDADGIELVAVNDIADADNLAYPSI